MKTQSSCIIIPDILEVWHLKTYLLEALDSSSEYKITILVENMKSSSEWLFDNLEDRNLAWIDLQDEVANDVPAGMGVLGNFSNHYATSEFLRRNDFAKVICPEIRALSYFASEAKRLKIDFLNVEFEIWSIGTTAASLLNSSKLPTQIYHLGLAFMEQKVLQRADCIVSSKRQMKHLRGDCDSLDSFRERDAVRLSVEAKDFKHKRDALPYWHVLLSRTPERVLDNTLLAIGQGDAQRAHALYVCSQKDYELLSTKNSDGKFNVKFLPSIHSVIKELSPEGQCFLFDPQGCNSNFNRMLESSGIIATSLGESGSCAGGLNSVQYNQAELAPESPKQIARATLNGEMPKNLDELALYKWSRNPSSVIENTIVYDGDDTPSVAVIVVHHQRTDYLTRTLRCLAAQDYSNFNVIVVDDGSSNEHLQEYWALASKYEETHPEWTFESIENAWLGNARNYGVSKTQSDYIVFVDDDNIPKPDMLSSFVKAIINSGLDLLTCFTHAFVADAYEEYDRDIPTVRNITLPIGGCYSMGIFDNVFGDASCIVRRSSFVAIDGYWRFYRLPKEDHDLFMRLLVDGYELGVIPRALFYYRVAKDGMMSANSANSAFDFSVNSIVSRYSPRKGLQLMSDAEAKLLNLILVSLWVDKGRQYRRIPKVVRSMVRVVLKLLGRGGG